MDFVNGFKFRWVLGFCVTLAFCSELSVSYAAGFTALQEKAIRDRIAVMYQNLGKREKAPCDLYPKSRACGDEMLALRDEAIEQLHLGKRPGPVSATLNLLGFAGADFVSMGKSVLDSINPFKDDDTLNKDTAHFDLNAALFAERAGGYGAASSSRTLLARKELGIELSNDTSLSQVGTIASAAK